MMSKLARCVAPARMAVRVLPCVFPAVRAVRRFASVAAPQVDIAQLKSSLSALPASKLSEISAEIAKLAKAAPVVAAPIEDQMKAVYEAVKAKDPNQTEFLQAVEEVLFSLTPLFKKFPEYLPVFRIMCEPERVIQFRVNWTDDQGKLQTNRGFRVQFNSAIGPYKGGLRLHPSVNLSVIKFLGFEQILKNSLTTLAMGGAKGGSDFDPKGKSDNEIMRFCQSFMNELYRHIGQFTDVPAGDIGVGGREIGYLFGQFKKITNRVEQGVLTGKGLEWGGSLIRPEATGYGLVYMVDEYMRDHGQSLKGKRVTVSGSGNAAQYTLEKLLHLGAVPITASDSNGYIYEKDGITPEGLNHIMYIKNTQRGRISEYVKFSKTAKYIAGKRPWEQPCEVALPNATQNEISEQDAKTLAWNGCKIVAEGANMPSTSEAIEVYRKSKMAYIPGKAANAGGVATSGLEMSQNSYRQAWTREEVDARLKGIMQNIYQQCKSAAELCGEPDNFQLGANAAGFLKVAKAMLDLGCL